jgi:hypothetical protein
MGRWPLCAACMFTALSCIPDQLAACKSVAQVTSRLEGFELRGHRPQPGAGVKDEKKFRSSSPSRQYWSLSRLRGGYNGILPDFGVSLRFLSDRASIELWRGTPAEAWNRLAAASLAALSFALKMLWIAFQRMAWLCLGVSIQPKSLDLSRRRLSCLVAGLRDVPKLSTPRLRANGPLYEMLTCIKNVATVRTGSRGRTGPRQKARIGTGTAMHATFLRVHMRFDDELRGDDPCPCLHAGA